MTAGRAYRGKRCMGGQLVYTPDGDVLDKHLHVLRRAPDGFHAFSLQKLRRIIKTDPFEV